MERFYDLHFCFYMANYTYKTFANPMLTDLEYNVPYIISYCIDHILSSCSFSGSCHV